MDKDYNDLHGDNLIHLFEMKWRKWDAKDCLKWFEYILTCKTIQSNNKNNKNEYDDVSDTESESELESESEDCISNLDSDSPLTAGGDNDGSTRTPSRTKDATSMIKESVIDYKMIETKLNELKCCGKRLPHLTNPYLFRQYGFTNKYHLKLLCKYTKEMVNKYPKQRKKQQKLTSEKSLSYPASVTADVCDDRKGNTKSIGNVEGSVE